MELISLQTIGEAVADPFLRLFRADGQAHAALLVLPGGLCRADRYDWIGALVGEGIHVAILDGVLSSFPPAAPGPSPAILQLAAACDWLGQMAVPLHGVGHSAGAAALLDALDPPSNPAALLPDNFALSVPFASVTSLGCSLQAQVLDWVLPHRSEDKALSCPARTRLLFIAGEQDRVAPPSLVARTCARYSPPARLRVLDQATHYGWAGPREEGDNPQSDADLLLDTASQRQRTLDILADFIAED